MNFTDKILKWYRKNKRDLPWRSKSPSAYKVWLSEIIMQQTRISQGTAYYLKFVENYPTIQQLAFAEEAEILKLWQGLGYYSRARNLHKTAKEIVELHNGKFPENYEELLKLKGIGEYTASAIASIVFKIPKAAVDGNVYRVLSRVFGIDSPIDETAGKKEFQILAQKLISSENPSDYNQGVMEFGALQCLPRNPDCKNCPLSNCCLAYKAGQVHDLPFKSKQTKQRKRYFNYLVIEQGDSIYIRKRKEKDIWQNLYDFPLLESSGKLSKKNLQRELGKLKILPKGLSDISHKQSEVHILSHQKIHASFTRFSIMPNSQISYSNAFPVKKSSLKNYAIPKLLENYLLNESDLLHLL